MMALMSFSRAHTPKNSQYWAKNGLSDSISWTNELILVKLNTIYHYFILQIWLDFGDLDLIFKGTGPPKLSALYLMNKSVDFGQT